MERKEKTGEAVLRKVYLGDAVYAERYDRYGIALTTEHGLETTNVIILEPETLEALRLFMEQMREDES